MKTINLFVALLLVGLLLALSAGGTIAQGPAPGGLVLWNKLGSNYEMLHSEVGPSFGTRPGVIYVGGLYGGALATTGGEVGGGGYLAATRMAFSGPYRTDLDEVGTYGDALMAEIRVEWGQEE